MCVCERVCLGLTSRVSCSFLPCIRPAPFLPRPLPPSKCCQRAWRRRLLGGTGLREWGLCRSTGLGGFARDVDDGPDVRHKTLTPEAAPWNLKPSFISIFSFFFFLYSCDASVWPRAEKEGPRTFFPLHVSPRHRLLCFHGCSC